MIETLDQALCNRCGVCMDVCPTDVFRIDEESGDYLIRYLDDCQTCFNCEIECPRDAIVVGPFRRDRVQAWDSSP